MSVCTVFVFMALMEYCLVNIVLGDNEAPKGPPESIMIDKIFNLAAKVSFATHSVIPITEITKLKFYICRKSRECQKVTNI